MRPAGRSIFRIPKMEIAARPRTDLGAAFRPVLARQEPRRCYLVTDRSPTGMEIR